jgi:hypothetical protein
VGKEQQPALLQQSDFGPTESQLLLQQVIGFCCNQ